jgi:hypothetical protein
VFNKVSFSRAVKRAWSIQTVSECLERAVVKRKTVMRAWSIKSVSACLERAVVKRKTVMRAWSNKTVLACLEKSVVNKVCFTMTGKGRGQKVNFRLAG